MPLGCRRLIAMFLTGRIVMPEPEQALPGRQEPMVLPEGHFISGNAMQPPFPGGMEQAVFGMGCFWGAERLFWQLPGVHVTAVGYAAGFSPNPSYEEVCSGLTGHAEVVLVVFSPGQISYLALLRAFWEGHDPCQGMRQGNDAGTQYRSVIQVFSEEQRRLAEDSRARYQQSLNTGGYGAITTEILPASDFYYAEPYHQQYLARNPAGYCGLGGTGVPLPESR